MYNLCDPNPKAMKKHSCKRTYLIGSFIFIAIVWVACRQNSFHSSIIDTHEHVELISKADLLLKADEANSIKKTILLASPIETLTLNGHKSFTEYRENTEEIFRIAEKYPNRFLPFCTVNPLDSDALEYLQSCFKRGGKGLKLYNGHSYYYAIFGIPLDSPRMEPIYAFAERNKIPVLYHINITNYGKELERVLDAHPDMVVSVPHFMVSSIELDKVTLLLDKYPNLYTDVSFGSPEFMAAGFRRISKDPGKYSNFINEYKDRILFGTDMVLSQSDKKDLTFIDETLACYRNMLEKRQFKCGRVIDYYKKVFEEKKTRYTECEPKSGDYCGSLKAKTDLSEKRLNEVISLNGMVLSPSVLEAIYWKNPNRFLNANQ